MRRWPRFRLSMVFVIATLLAVPFAMWSRESRRYQREQAILALVPGAVDWGYRCPEWMIRLLGSERCEVFRTVVTLGEPTDGLLIHAYFRDETMELIDDAEFQRLLPLFLTLPNLHTLYLGNSRITDASVPLIAQITGLKRVELLGAAVTPDGIAHLQALRPDLEIEP